VTTSTLSLDETFLAAWCLAFFSALMAFFSALAFVFDSMMVFSTAAFSLFLAGGAC